jgi:arylsulfatase A-like enzyme
MGITSGIVSHFHPPAMLGEREPWLPTIMRELGCRTGAVDHLFSMKEWFIRGYDDYIVPAGRSRSPASVVNELAFPWLTSHAEEDFFGFLHYWDAHIPYVPPEPFLSEYTEVSRQRADPLVDQRLMERPTYPLFKLNLYDHLGVIPNLEYIADLHRAEVAYLDHEIGNLFNHLDSLGILDDTMIVVFGDHGEVMTEHDSWFDHAGLYDAVVHVPLIIKMPGDSTPKVVDDLVALVDVFPTTLDILGVEPPPHGDGISLLPLLEGRAQIHRSFVPLSECTWEAKRGLRTERWKFIQCYDAGIYPCADVELYDLDVDPNEQDNVADSNLDVVAIFSQQLEAWVQEMLAGQPDPMSAVIAHGLPAIERLRKLEEGSGTESTLTARLGD